MIKINNINVPIGFDDSMLRKIVADSLKTKDNNINSVRILKKSIDARKKDQLKYVLSLSVEVLDERAVLNKNPSAMKYVEPKRLICELELPKKKTDKNVVVVGSGPAGLFAALTLIQSGVNVTVLERGLDVDARSLAVVALKLTGELNEKTNVQFGEGGAGTFSDGKLNTGTSSELISVVLGEFVRYGAPGEIEYVSKPHIGTDYLKVVVKAMREEIVARGGKVIFDAKMEDFKVANGKVCSVKVGGKDNFELDCDCLILAVGHSARDTFELLYAKGLNIIQKGFSMGVRIEHLQKDIDFSQYGVRSEFLPAADYKLACHLNDNRSVYTFCMCPGGEVVCASSESGGIVTNGMSNFARNENNANSAVLVNVNAADFGSEHPLAGMYYQRKYEAAAFNISKSYSAPTSTLKDFYENRVGTNFLNVTPSYRPKPTFASFDECLPGYIVNALKQGINSLNGKLKGFNNPSAVITGVETRSSSPIRIIRGDNYQSNIQGIFPCGEGAGYAGGITSSAVDGIKTAIKVLETL